MPADIVTTTAPMIVEDTTTNTNTSVTLLTTENTTEFTSSGDGLIVDFDTTLSQQCKYKVLVVKVFANGTLIFELEISKFKLWYVQFGFMFNNEGFSIHLVSKI